MPSKSPAQAKLMRAVAHGWKPDRIKGPSRAVAREFVEADKKYSGGFAENRYWTGGLAAMNEVNSGVPVTLSFQEGGEVPRVLDMGNFKDILAQGWYVDQGWFWDPDTSTVYPPQQTAAAAAGGEDPAASLAELTPEIRGDATEVTPFIPRVIPGAGPLVAGPSGQTAEERAEQTALARQSKYRDQLREHKSRVAAALNPANAARGGHMNYQEGGAARRKPDVGGGAPIPGHMEGSNPHPPGTALWRLWEGKYHIAPPEPDPETVPLPQPDDPSWLERLFGIGELKDRTAEELEALGEARGGHVRGYQVGGLARFNEPSRRSQFRRPAGGIPPSLQGRTPRAGGVPPQMDASARMAGLRGQQQQQRQALTARSGAPRWSPQQQQAWRGRQQLQRGAPSAPQPGGFMGRVRQMAEQQRAGQQRAGRTPPGMAYAGGTPGFYGPGGPGRGPDLGGGRTPEWGRGAPGGPRVPPNMQGFLQRQRMMNRPPSNVGGGVNRVGQQDQQGALARAMQRGTGRRPMSRRGGFPGRGGVR